MWHVVPPHTIAAAEWNALLPAAGGAGISGRVHCLAAAADGAQSTGPPTLGTPGKALGTALLLLASEAEVGGDYCSAATSAAALGAAALLIACDGVVTRPMAFGTDQTAPTIPAVMLPRGVAADLRRGIELPGGVLAHLKILQVEAIVEDSGGGGGGVDEGRMADVVALDDATSQGIHGKVLALQAEKERLTSALRFASRVQRQLATPSSMLPEGTAPSSAEDAMPLSAAAQPTLSCCPICLEPSEAVCVLPECFHCLCRACLQRAAGGASSFRCPLCRVRAMSWTVTVFRTQAAALAVVGDECSGEVMAPLPSGLRMLPAEWRQLPTKLQRMLTLVHGILAEVGHSGTAAGGEERILVYTQFLSHVDYLCRTLGRAGVACLGLNGDLGHCMRCLSLFGQEGAPRVLVLSSQHHSSGINLQVARNLIVMHPYCTPSATYPEAISFAQLQAFEAQAVGRIRRYPQTATVRVYRLWAADTVEEALYRGGYTTAAWHARDDAQELGRGAGGTGRGAY